MRSKQQTDTSEGINFAEACTAGNTSDLHQHLDKICAILKSLVEDATPTQSAQLNAAQEELEKLSGMLARQGTRG
jgi:hypothetical protein